MDRKRVELLVRALIQDNGRVLVCKKIGKRYFFFPGGHVEPGENPEKALARELREELGARIKECSLVGQSEHSFEEEGKRHHEINLLFNVETDRITTKSKEKHIEFFFFDAKQIRKSVVYPEALKRSVLKWLKGEGPFSVKKYGKYTDAKISWKNRFYGKEGKLLQNKLSLPHKDFKKFVALFRGSKDKRVLDLGCGTGRYTIALSEEGFKVYGIDWVEKVIKITKQKLKKEGLTANLKTGDIYKKLPYNNNFFDGIISIKVIHHNRVSKIKKLIKEMERVMKPGGILMIEVPKKNGRKNDKKFKKVEPETFINLEGLEKGVLHHVFTNKQELKDLFPNFEIVDIHLTGKNGTKKQGIYYTMFAKMK
jgi:ubiquinone/menaquinone biosynthesis C-methylase UbiE/8-oxo-dGTP pyrophosphatase MutT (NUDIX family)